MTKQRLRGHKVAGSNPAWIQFGYKLANLEPNWLQAEFELTTLWPRSLCFAHCTTEASLREEGKFSNQVIPEKRFLRIIPIFQFPRDRINPDNLSTLVYPSFQIPKNEIYALTVGIRTKAIQQSQSSTYHCLSSCIY